MSVRLMIAAVRTLLWAAAFFAGSLFIVVAAAVFGTVSRRTLLWLVHQWAVWQRCCTRWILGQRVVVDGALPPGPAFVVMKHEAMFETIDVMLLLHRPVVFAKAELFTIPLWGPLALRYGLIPIARDTGAKALRTMRASAQAAIAAGRPIALFPEGTRVLHGKHPSIRSGFAGLYKLLALPVVPVAVDSGRLVRLGWIRLSGTIHYRVGAVIPPGLAREEAEELAHRAINALNPPEG